MPAVDVDPAAGGAGVDENAVAVVGWGQRLSSCVRVSVWGKGTVRIS